MASNQHSTRERERERSTYCHKPIIQGVDYSSLMMKNSVEALVKDERRPEAIPAAVPPPIFEVPASVSGFLYVFFSVLRLVARSRRGPYI